MWATQVPTWRRRSAPRHAYEKLTAALEAKKAGLEYSVTGFEFLLPKGWEAAQTDKLKR